MSVYVDEMISCLRSKSWPYNRSCHLVADSVEELHVFAKRLGLKKSWFQDRPYLPHYDLTTGMRFRAIRLGAIALDQSQFAEFMRKTRPRSAGLKYLNLTGTSESNLYEFHHWPRRAKQ